VQELNRVVAIRSRGKRNFIIVVGFVCSKITFHGVVARPYGIFYPLKGEKGEKVGKGGKVGKGISTLNTSLNRSFSAKKAR
jgi:hypothetical protein